MRFGDSSGTDGSLGFGNSFERSIMGGRNLDLEDGRRSFGLNVMLAVPLSISEAECEVGGAGK